MEALLQQSIICLAGQDPVLEKVLIVAVSPGPKAQLVPVDLPTVGIHPHRTDALLTVTTLAYFGNHLPC